MKKARLMLSAVAIFAVVGTAFAFSANRFADHFVYTGTLGSGICQAKKTFAAISSPSPTDILVAASTVSLASGCPDQFTIAVTND
jgi:hypothetical protein